MNGVRFDLTMDELEIKSMYEEEVIISISRRTRRVDDFKNDILDDGTRKKLTEIGQQMLNMIDGEVAELCQNLERG